MNIEKLQKQKAALEAQIAKAELAAKNQGKVEKVVLKLLAKHPELYLIDIKVFEKNLGEMFADLSLNLTKPQA